MAKNLFVTFEGIEGSGKTTQIQKLKNVLNKQGYKVRTTREPGGTPISDQIRNILLSRKNKNMIPLTELLLYEASRAQHVEEVILPALNRGEVIICDRFADATTVYQGTARKLSPVLVKRLNQIATAGLKPHLTIVLDCPVETGLYRARKRKTNYDRFEREKDTFHVRIRQSYLKLAKREPKRVKIVDGTQNPEDVHKEILNLILKYI